MPEYELRRVGFQWIAPIVRQGREDTVRVSLGQPGLSYQRVVAVVDDETGEIVLDITEADGSHRPMRVVDE
jgi:hypothetical protein